MLAWYDRAQRDLPWRHTSDPYAIWLSETMLQQTQVATVIPYYQRFLALFPTVAALAQASRQQVLTAWAGLGYYRRARHLHEAAQQMVERHNGQVPATLEALRALPGIGRYTAGAVASIAFGQRAPVLDGNVMRVLARLLVLRADIAKPQTQKYLWEVAERLVPVRRPGDFNQALMELGATICTPVAPKCNACPVRRLCRAAAAGVQEELPVKRAKKPRPVVRRVAVVLTAGSDVLLLQRPAGVLWEHMWEFPLLEVSEKLRAAFTEKRENASSSFNWLAQIADMLQVHLGSRVTLDRWQGSVTHQLTHRTMEYRIVRGQIRNPLCAIPLPVCESARYLAQRWVRQWPPEGLPLSRLTHKIAAAAGIGERASPGRR